MPRPKTDAHWALRVATLSEEIGRPAQIFRVIEQEAAAAGRTKTMPSERTVRRLYEEHAKRAPEVRREAGLFKWPHSMLHAELPWDAARDALDLLRYRLDSGFGRPTIRQVRWFRRVRQADPSIPTDLANRLSARLAAQEFADDSESTAFFFPDYIELELAYEIARDQPEPSSMAAAKAQGYSSVPQWGDSGKGGAEALEVYAYAAFGPLGMRRIAELQAESGAPVTLEELDGAVSAGNGGRDE